MRLLNAEVWNFCSYKHLKFSYGDTGVCLISGTTGAGKSTLADIPTWIICGVTAKGGTVDEVISWQSNGDLTDGHLTVDTGNGEITIQRTRGKRAYQNDLFYTEASSPDVLIRGKDISDTQRLLLQRLGITVESYLNGVCFSEFSSSANFFRAKGKERQRVLEGISDLSLSNKLKSSVSEELKVVRRDVEINMLYCDNLHSKISVLNNDLATLQVSAENWIQDRETAIIDLMKSVESFESTKKKTIDTHCAKLAERKDAVIGKIASIYNKIDELSVSADQVLEISRRRDAMAQKVSSINSMKCGVCCNTYFTDADKQLKDDFQKINDRLNRCVVDAAKIEELLSTIKELESGAVDPFHEVIELERNRQNPYLDQLKMERSKVNPFHELIEKKSSDVGVEKEILNFKRITLDDNVTKCSDLETLYSITNTLRAVLLGNSMHALENQTNEYLIQYFDGEIRAHFTMEDDALEVSILKNGYECSYAQLSRGQRSLLRLCFVVSLMKATSNNSGVHFDNLFFDEILDGLSSELKVKAFSLLESLQLEHPNILCIDHAVEFQNMFSRRYSVKLEGDASIVEECE